MRFMVRGASSLDALVFYPPLPRHDYADSFSFAGLDPKSEVLMFQLLCGLLGHLFFCEDVLRAGQKLSVLRRVLTRFPSRREPFGV